MFPEGEQFTHWHLKLILTSPPRHACSESWAQHTWDCTRSDLLLGSRYLGWDLFFLIGFKPPRTIILLLKTHPPSHHTFPVTCLVCFICEFFCTRLAGFLCLSAARCEPCLWPLDKGHIVGIVKTAAILLAFKEASCLTLLSQYKVC